MIHSRLSEKRAEVTIAPLDITKTNAFQWPTKSSVVLIQQVMIYSNDLLWSETKISASILQMFVTMQSHRGSWMDVWKDGKFQVLHTQK